jgi:hypothetical protein
MRRRLAERGLDQRVDRKEIPSEKGPPVDQSPQTTTRPNRAGERHEVEFTTYTPLGTPNSLWVAWDAAASAAEKDPAYPNAYVRLARIDMSK